MKKKHSISVVLLLVLPIYIFAQKADPYEPDFNPPPDIPGMKLVWHDEFNNDGRPDTSVWIYENGFVRNRELQWYQPDNAYCARGMLTIEGRRENIKNPGYVKGSKDWRKEREYADYSSASIQTRGHRKWLFGRFVIRARIDTSWGAWPAIWTLGINKRWPENGEIDIMEFYRINSKPVILANFAWGTGIPNKAEWDDLKKPLSDFIAEDPHWPAKFHVWRMDWNEDSISLYLDDKVLNTISLKKTVNPDGFNPFLQQHYLLLNLAIGANGGDPGNALFPLKYEVDYVRVYQYK